MTLILTERAGQTPEGLQFEHLGETVGRDCILPPWKDHSHKYIYIERERGGLMSFRLHGHMAYYMF